MTTHAHVARLSSDDRDCLEQAASAVKLALDAHLAAMAHASSAPSSSARLMHLNREVDLAMARWYHVVSALSVTSSDARNASWLAVLGEDEDDEAE